IRGYLQDWFNISIPGLGLVALFILISFLGFAGRSIIFRPIGRLVNRLMDRAPFLKLIYGSIKDLLNAFVGKERKFNKPVLVKVNLISDLEKIGFLTQEDLNDLGIKDKVSVYFPHSYNFSGEMFIVPREHVRPIDMSPSDAMKFVVSGGAAMS
ncbi:MAG: DUF502 domain-containing protein, partial [Bacteroidales bacterium]|nr:DUF502 domain-containing protein [Bacteroidales bacterium]